MSKKSYKDLIEDSIKLQERIKRLKQDEALKIGLYVLNNFSEIDSLEKFKTRFPLQTKNEKGTIGSHAQHQNLTKSNSDVSKKDAKKLTKSTDASKPSKPISTDASKQKVKVGDKKC